MMRLGVEPREDSEEAFEAICSMARGAGRPFGSGEACAGSSGVEGGMGSFAGAGDGAAAEAGMSILVKRSTQSGLGLTYGDWRRCRVGRDKDAQQAIVTMAFKGVINSAWTEYGLSGRVAVSDFTQEIAPLQ
jgi:hypothetical protein